NFEEVMELEYPVALLEPLAFILGRLLDRLCARLEARSLSTHELRLRLELEAGVEAETDIGIRDSGLGARDCRFSIDDCRLEKVQSSVFNRQSAISDRQSRVPSPEPRVLRLPVPTRDAKLLLKLWLLHLKSDPPP